MIREEAVALRAPDFEVLRSLVGERAIEFQFLVEAAGLVVRHL